MRLVYGHNAAVAAWVAAQIPSMADCDFGPLVAIGVIDRDGALVGGVVFHGYRPTYRSIEASFASTSRRWLTKSLIAQIMSYPFDQLLCERVTATTPRKAASARRFLDVFGFKREGLVRRGFGNDDAVISGLLKSEWQRSRWAQPREVRNEQTAAGRAP